MTDTIVYKINNHSVPTVSVESYRGSGRYYNSDSYHHIMDNAPEGKSFDSLSLDPSEFGICADLYEEHGMVEHAAHLRDVQACLSHNVIEIGGKRFTYLINRTELTDGRVYNQRKLEIKTLSSGKVKTVYLWTSETSSRQKVIELIVNEKKVIARREAKKAKSKAAKANFINPYKKGDIFYTSWGWEQTNVDFYQVVGTTKMGVKIQRIRSKHVNATGPFSSQVVADKNNFCDADEKPATVILQWKSYGDSEAQHSLSYKDHGLYLYDGKPQHCSWGH